MTFYIIIFMSGVVTHGKIPQENDLRVYSDMQKACEAAKGRKVYEYHFHDSYPDTTFRVMRCKKKESPEFELEPVVEAK